MLASKMNTDSHTPAFLGIEECRKAVFGTGPEAPSKRSWDEWRARGYYPHLKVGKRVFADPTEVKKALERRFKIHAIQP